jgi:hypothetical protein
MKCPACFNELKPLQVGQVTVDVCQGGCGGIWFDALELQRVDEQDEAAGEWLLDIQRDKSIQVDARRKRECPRCEGVKLERHFFSRKRQVEVDDCPGCVGYWLDAGELERIRQEMKEAKVIRQARQPGLTSSVVRYLYQMRQEPRE